MIGGMAKTKSKIPTVYFGVRLPVDVVTRVRQRALDNDRKIGAEMARLLRSALDGAPSPSSSAAEEVDPIEEAKRTASAVRLLGKVRREQVSQRAKRKLERAAKRKMERGK
jgi:hypothetical protein